MQLPEFAFIDDCVGEDWVLDGRTVILHIRSMMIFEIFSSDTPIDFNDDVVRQTFRFVSDEFQTDEDHILAVHVNVLNHSEEAVKEVMEQLWKWYSDYMNWEDQNIQGDKQAVLN